ncbi:scavenger receptor cysteine-rich type 1 M130-like protein [Labeo rohita]|uniref:Scavenger receptor cysteine-rich type 1 M130-like protein n=1 Tax=Labeo rohita TaxID=84645 RepID=A0A498NK09_LABRO|nr:scavenger receptor cysteine-rich type 1 M130-like protein [Labeo rohita]
MPVLLYHQCEKAYTDSSLSLHDGLVRLSGERQCEGEVEIFIHQVWRRVLLDSWSLTESSVVCRQLGCGSVLNFYGSSSSSPEHSHECVTGFQCSGSEAHLGNCSSSQTFNCSSTQQLSITCLEFKEIRLTEGCEGNVEVFYNGSWARVKSAPNWLDKMKCRPHDSTLWQCPSSPWGQSDCDEDEVAKIICSEQESHESSRSYLTCTTSLHQRQCSGDLPGNYDVVIIRQFSNDKAGSLISEELHSGFEDADEFLSDTPESYDDAITRCEKLVG